MENNTENITGNNMETIVDQVNSRKRGGQFGNQNARVHGFYSKVLTPDEQESLDTAGDVVGIDSEIALLRVKLESILKHDPNNIELIAKAVTALTRMLMVRNRIRKEEGGGLKQAVLDALKELALPVGIGIGKAFQK
jgi:hypothetical protein